MLKGLINKLNASVGIRTLESYTDKELMFHVAKTPLNIRVKGKTPLNNLNVNDYVKGVFSDNGLVYVEDVVYCYCLRYKLHGMGEKSWEEFFHAVG